MTHYGEGTPRPAGSVLTVKFVLDGIEFVALNGGPQFKFSPAISLVINCDTQDEVDYYWTQLLSGGGLEQQCGWLNDRYGVSWQVVPTVLPELLSQPDRAAAQRTMTAMLQMKKLDIATLKRASEIA